MPAALDRIYRMNRIFPWADGHAWLESRGDVRIGVSILLTDMIGHVRHRHECVEEWGKQGADAPNL